MNYTIDKKSSRPAYLQLYEFVKREIVSETYPYGSKLPSKRVMAVETGVSVITVEHAFQMLAEEGYIENRQRSGYFVIYRSRDFMILEDSPSMDSDAMQWTASGTAVNGLTMNLAEPVPVIQTEYEQRIPEEEEMSFDLLSKTMRRVILDQGERMMLRSGNKGCLEVREEIRRYLARSAGIHVNLSQIVMGSGAEYLYFLIAGLFPEKKCFAIEDPSYKMIALAYERMGKNVQRVPIAADGISTESLKALKADLLHVTPFHSYPSGATADVSKRNEYLHWAVKNHTFLVEDNYDSEFTVSRKQEETLFSMDSDHVIYLNTFSKTIASAMRVGYMILPEHLLDLYDEKFGEYSCTVPVFEQLLIAELMASGTFERHINRVRRNRRKKMKKRTESILG